MCSMQKRDLQIVLAYESDLILPYTGALLVFKVQINDVV